MKLTHELIGDSDLEDRDFFTLVPVVAIEKLVPKIQSVRAHTCFDSDRRGPLAPTGIAACGEKPVPVLLLLIVTALNLAGRDLVRAGLQSFDKSLCL